MYNYNCFATEFTLFIRFEFMFEKKKENKNLKNIFVRILGRTVHGLQDLHKILK